MPEPSHDHFTGDGDRVFEDRRTLPDRRSYDEYPFRGARTFRDEQAFGEAGAFPGQRMAGAARIFGGDRLVGEARVYRDNRSLGELFGQLTGNMSMLMRQELQLAKAELAEKAVRARKDAVAVGTGGIVAYLGGLALMAAIILFLTQVVGIVAWLSALLVGLVCAGVGYAMLNRGLRDMGAIDPKPQRTVDTMRNTVKGVRNDIQLVKEQRS
jgi:hypothetical protein